MDGVDAACFFVCVVSALVCRSQDNPASLWTLVPELLKERTESQSGRPELGASELLTGLLAAFTG
jgi:hypothetical protein